MSFADISGTQKPSSRKIYIGLVVACIVGFVVGILIGRFATCPDSSETPDAPKGLFLPGVSESLMRDEDESVIDELMNSISSDNIRNNLK